LRVRNEERCGKFCRPALPRAVLNEVASSTTESGIGMTFPFVVVIASAFPLAVLGLGACADETSSPWCDGSGVVVGKIGPDGKCIRRDASADSSEGPDATLVIPDAGLDADATSADAAPVPGDSSNPLDAASTSPSGVPGKSL
jgi:hypothetical protein